MLMEETELTMKVAAKEKKKEKKKKDYFGDQKGLTLRGAIVLLFAVNGFVVMV